MTAARPRRRLVVSALILAVVLGWMLDADWGPNLCDNTHSAVSPR